MNVPEEGYRKFKHNTASPLKELCFFLIPKHILSRLYKL